MSGDIVSTAGLTVHEPNDGVVHFARWRPFNQNAVSRSAVLAPAREEDMAGRESLKAFSQFLRAKCYAVHDGFVGSVSQAGAKVFRRISRTRLASSPWARTWSSTSR